MSSPLSNFSPVDGNGRRTSQFTYRQLGLLASYSTSSPLRVIAHIDLDAFYAQCEMVRLDIDEKKPVAVQQWQGLIAVNYPARKFGIGRHCTITEARKLCPDLISQHVATWKEGEEKWAYHDDAAANIRTHKVSLDPYRLESRRILALIKQCLPASTLKVEKASIDEVFIDLSAQVHGILLQRFPELALPPPYDDPTENLPLPSVSALDWKADALVDLDDAETETDDPDWDDVAILIGSEIVRDIRAEIYRSLHYTCSAGIASNKMLSKLGSGHKKPNQQTVIRNRAVQRFLSDMKFTKIRNLGGKLGEQVQSIYSTDSIKEMLNISAEQLKLKLGDDTGIWFYNTIRGTDLSEVTSRTQVKSMLSAKSFQPSIKDMESAVRWLRIFSADIFSRLIEEGVLENKRRPKTIHLHHRCGGQTSSRSGSIPQGKALDEATLFDLAKHMMTQISNEGKVWPCSSLSLSVAGFEEGITGNMGIDTFLLKGDQAKTTRDSSPALSSHEPKMKKRRVESHGIQRFFSKKESSNGEYGGGSTNTINSDQNPNNGDGDGDGYGYGDARVSESDSHLDSVIDNTCPHCKAILESAELLQTHLDWHIAKDLQDQECGRSTSASGNRPVVQRNEQQDVASAPFKNHTTTIRGKKLEQGQSRLRFG